MQKWFCQMGRCVIASCFLFFSLPAQAEDSDDLRQKLEALEREIQALKRRIQDTDAKAETVVEALENSQSKGHGHGGGHGGHGGGHGGHGGGHGSHGGGHGSHGGGHGDHGGGDGGHGGGHGGHGGGHGGHGGEYESSRTNIGGFGELHYNSSKDEVDFHRFVLFFGHHFNDWISLSSELSLEHAVVGDDSHGELELEQAYVNFALTDSWDLKTGVMRVPVGLLNEIHEPGTFYGVDRNRVETAIIPTGWWEAAVMTSHNFRNGLGIDAMLSSGLSVANTETENNAITNRQTAFTIRNGRQKVSEAPAKDGAFTARLRWSGVPGIYLSAVAQYQSDLLQNTRGASAPAWLTNVNADLYKGPFALRALWARWDISDANAKAIGRNEQWGFYVEPSYRHALDGRWGDVGVFYRYTLLDQTAGDKNGSQEIHQQTGLNYWPIRNVVFKADYDTRTHSQSGEEDIFSLGMGYQF